MSHWIDELKRGSEDPAARVLWERYFEKLVQVARRQLANMPRRVADEEDVALSAFKSFYEAARKGRFPALADREGLWRLLLKMTARKAVDLKRYLLRQRRNVAGDSARRDDDSRRRASAVSQASAISQVIGDEPTPEFASMVAEELRGLMNLLEDEDLQAVAVAKMEGYTNAEIARRLDCSVRTVERQLQLIRRKWEEEAPP